VVGVHTGEQPQEQRSRFAGASSHSKLMQTEGQPILHIAKI
jgi:hypothetical protein